MDIPECGLVAILDADKEGFLRSRTSLVQTIGRAARNVDGHVVLYADNMTKSMSQALSETERRRNIQAKYNEEHGIIPKSVMSRQKTTSESKTVRQTATNVQKAADLEKKMREAAENLQFEEAAKYRDALQQLQT